MFAYYFRWTSEAVNEKLKEIMNGAFETSFSTAKRLSVIYPPPFLVKGTALAT
jgi:glutamate dehydrogenase/leucine dehydrogenase